MKTILTDKTVNNSNIQSCLIGPVQFVKLAYKISVRQIATWRNLDRQTKKHQ